MLEVAETCPREDRTAERRVFVGFTPEVAKNVMARACKAAGIVHRHPHDLRHRYASVQIGPGVPVTTVAAQLGHSRKSLTLDTYSLVLVDLRAGKPRAARACRFPWAHPTGEKPPGGRKGDTLGSAFWLRILAPQACAA
jgi:integrase